MSEEARQELVQEWLIKAENDLDGARVLGAADEALIPNAIFHCQQAFEKDVKGFLVYHDQRFQKKHDIEYLLNLATPYESEFSTFKEESKLLTPFATVYRYPGYEETFTDSDFEVAVELANRLYQFVLSLLPPEVYPPS